MRIQKLSLDLELARHHAERQKETSRQRTSKYDSRSLVSLFRCWFWHSLTRVVEQANHESLCSQEVRP
jgi:hypothetical protein